MTDTPTPSITPPEPAAADSPLAPAAGSALGRGLRVHLLLIVGLIVLTGIFQVYAFRYVRSYAEEWLTPTAPVVLTQYPGPTTVDVTISEQRKRVLAQLALTKQREIMHRELAVHFLQNYYMAVFITMVMAGIAAIALLGITGRGWASAHPLVRTTFVTATALASFFGAFPTVFKQAENFEANLTAYRLHIALENEIMTYLVTGLKSDGKKATVEEFLVHVDGELARLHHLAIAMDPGKMPGYSFATGD